MVTIGIQYHCQTMEEIFGPKNRALNHPFFGIPDRKSIPEKIFAFARHFKLYLELPVS